MKFILVVVATAFLVTACNKRDTQSSTAQEKHIDSLKVFSLKAEKLEKHISLPGELFSYEKVEVRPKLTGYIKQLKVDIGSPVKKGQVIAVIDAPEVQSRLGEGTGRMNASKAKYETSLDMYQRIVEASKTAGVISPSEMQKARNQMLSDSADYQAQKFSNESYKQVGA